MHGLVLRYAEVGVGEWVVESVHCVAACDRDLKGVVELRVDDDYLHVIRTGRPEEYDLDPVA